MSASYCSGCGTVARHRSGLFVEHYVDGVRCAASGGPLGGRLPAPPRARARCAHSSTMRQGDRRVCADCGEPRP